MMSNFPVIQQFMEEDELTIFKTTEGGNLFLIRENRYIVLPSQTCPRDMIEPPVYKIPGKYPSIELTPIHVLVGMVVLFFAFFIGKKTEKHRRTLERRKKKQLKKFKSNEQYLEERANFFFNESFPVINFKDYSTRSRKASEDNAFNGESQRGNSNFLENSDFKMLPQFEERKEEDALVPYGKPKVENFNILIDEEKSANIENQTKVEKTFILNWPLLDPKFGMNMDFTLKVENGMIKSLSTNSNVSKEAFHKLMSLLMEKYLLKFQKIGSKTEISLEPKETNETLSLTNLNNDDEIMKMNSFLALTELNKTTNTKISECDGESRENHNIFDKKELELLTNAVKPLEIEYQTTSIEVLKLENSKEKEELFDLSGKKSKSSKISNNSKKNYEAIENEKCPTDGQEEKAQLEVKHFQFDLFENGRFTKLFNSLQEIGKGAFGEVYKVIHKIENSIYAIKKVYLPLKVNEDIRTNKYFREVMLMTKFNHKNVIRYHTSWLEEPENDFKDQYLARRKEMALKKEKRKKKKRSSSSSSLNHIEEQKEENISNWSNHERTKLSSLGFEWVASEKSLDHAKTTPKNIKSKYSVSKSQSSMSVSRLTELQKGSLKNVLTSKNSENAEHWSAIIDKMTADQIPIVLFIQMHYSRQSLRNFLDVNTRKMDRLLNFQMFKQMIEGIKYIHSNGIIHRDLKPANIFIDEDNTILIGDFGLSVVLQNNINLANTMSQDNETLIDSNLSLSFSKRHAQSLTKNIGTPLYLAPEQEKGQNYDEKVDIYALGLILLEMCTFIKTGHERFCMFNDIRKCQKIPESLKKQYKQEAELIVLMTNTDPKMRPSSGEIEKCPEFKAWKEILNKK